MTDEILRAGLDTSDFTAGGAEIKKTLEEVAAAAAKTAEQMEKLGGQKGSDGGALGSATKKTEEFTDAQKAQKAAMADLQGAARGTSGALDAWGRVLNGVHPIALAAAAAVGAIGFALKASIQNWADTERSMLRFAAVSRATGMAAGVTATEIENLARSLEQTTMASSDAVRDSATRLQTFGAVAGEQFKQTIVLAQDLAAVMGTEVTSATQMLGRALADPVQGMTMLRRAGIILSDSQKTLIRDLQETGRQVQATAALLEIIEKKVGGAGGMEASGAAGAFHRWDNAAGDLGKALGKLAIDALPVVEVANSLTVGINGVADALISLSQFSKDNSWLFSINGLLGAGGGKPSNGAKPLVSGNPLQQEFFERMNRNRNSSAPAPSFSNYESMGMSDASGTLEIRKNIAAAEELARSLDTVNSKRAENVRQQELLNRSIDGASVLGGEYTASIDKMRGALAQLQAQYKLIQSPMDQFLEGLESQAKIAQAGPGMAGQLAGNLEAGRKAALASGRDGLDPAEEQRIRDATKSIFASSGIADSANITAGIRGMNELIEAYKRGTPEIAKAQANMTAYGKSVGGVGNAALELAQIIAQGNLALAEAAYNAEMAADDNTRLAAAYLKGVDAGADMEAQIRAEQLARQNLVDVTDELISAFQREDAARKVLDAAKAIAGLEEETRLTKLLADSIREGAAAHRDMEARVEVMRRLGPDAFNRTADAAERLLLALKNNNEAIGDYRTAQDILSIGNEIKLRERELQLAGATTEERARALAVTRAQITLDERGIELASARGQEYLAIVEKQELLNQKIAEQRKAEELALQPFKNAISGIQNEFTNMFVNVFSGGVTSFKSLAASVKQIFIRMAAEIATLLVFKPVVGGILGSLGIDTAALGLGGAGVGSSPLNLLFGGGQQQTSVFGGSATQPGGMLGGGNLFGGSSGIGSFFSKPVSSIFGSGNSAYNEGMLFPGESAIQGSSYAGGFLDNLTVGQGLGALAGVGSGVMQLSQGGTANTIGGIASIVGAGVSLIPGIGQILGPLISIGGGLLGGLFSKKPKKFPRSRFSLLTTDGDTSRFEPGGSPYVDSPFGTIGYNEDGSNERFTGSANAVPFLNTIRDIDRALAGELTQEQIELVRYGIQGVAGREESFRDDPNGREYFAATEDRLTKVMRSLYGDQIGAKAFTGIARSDDNIGELADRALEIIQMKNALADFGKEIPEARDAVKELNKKFNELSENAEQYGFSLTEIAAIEAERRASLERLSTDLQGNISDAILGFTDPLALELKRLDESFAALRLEAEYLNTITDNQIDTALIDQQYALERAAIVDARLGGLKDFQKAITYGGLSGAAPLVSLEGARETFRETAAKALLGNGTAAGQIEGYGTDYIQSLRGYYGSSADFQAGLKEVQDVVAAVLEQQGTTNPVVIAINQAAVETIRQLTINNQQVTQINDLIAQLPLQLQELIANIRRLVSAN